jgi:hypothetical protein
MLAKVNGKMGPDKISELFPAPFFENVNSFTYPQTTIQTAGRNALLGDYFTVYPLQRRSAFL